MQSKTLIAASFVLLIAISTAEAAAPASPAAGAPSTNGIVGAALETVPLGSSAAEASWTIAKAVLPGYTIRHTVPEVRLQFTVADERGRLVKDLQPGDLNILDDHSAVRRLREFSRLQDLPLQIGILIDVSDSVRKTVFREKLATQFFVQRVLRPQTDRAFLMAFGSDVKLWQPSTGDSSALRQAVDQIRQQGYVTNLYDGLFSACLGQFPQLGEQDTTQRVIVLFSDGDDTGSLHALGDVIALAQRNEIQLYALTVHSLRIYSPGDEVLQRLAEQTGGGFYVANSEKDFPAIFSAMEQQMRTQYSVSFQPVEQTPGFHSLQLEMAGPVKRQVHVRQGYYFDAP